MTRLRLMRIEGTSALVVGGASGLGEATARRLHADGASVMIADLNVEKGEALAAELGGGPAFAEANVLESEQLQSAVDAAAAEGGLRISVCCAGIGWAQRTVSKEGPHDLDMFSNVIKVNLIGTFNVLRLAATAMTENEPDPGGERGVFINTASIAAFDGQIGQTAYSASKGGIVALTLPARPRPRQPRRTGDDDRSRPLRHPVARRAPRAGPRGARRRRPPSRATRLAVRVRRPCRRDHHQPDAQR